MKGKVLKMERPAAGGFLSLTNLRAEGCGIAMGPLCGPGSKGSEGSACLWQAGSKGGGLPYEQCV